MLYSLITSLFLSIFIGDLFGMEMVDDPIESIDTSMQEMVIGEDSLESQLNDDVDEDNYLSEGRLVTSTIAVPENVEALKLRYDLDEILSIVEANKYWTNDQLLLLVNWLDRTLKKENDIYKKQLRIAILKKIFIKQSCQEQIVLLAVDLIGNDELPSELTYTMQLLYGLLGVICAHAHKDIQTTKQYEWLVKKYIKIEKKYKLIRSAEHYKTKEMYMRALGVPYKTQAEITEENFLKKQSGCESGSGTRCVIF